MNTVPTTTVDILGGAGAVDEWGDPTEDTTVLAAGIPASITEARQVVATESDPQAVAVHYYTGRLPAGTSVTKDHRLRDAAGQLYSIDYVNIPNMIGTPGDVRLDLRRVT
jgi:hypothetical protein